MVNMILTSRIWQWKLKKEQSRPSSKRDWLEEKYQKYLAVSNRAVWLEYGTCVRRL